MRNVHVLAAWHESVPVPSRHPYPAAARFLVTPRLERSERTTYCKQKLSELPVASVYSRNRRTIVMVRPSLPTDRIFSSEECPVRNGSTPHRIPPPRRFRGVA